jgi:hypothetical protein
VLPCAGLTLHWCLQHALLPASLVAAGGAATTLGWWRLLSDCGARDTRRLRLHSDGRVVLVVEGVPRRYRLSPGSLWLGRQVLLVLRSGPRRVRVLLGPGNLCAEQQAALGRWLRRSPGEGLAAGVLR